MAARDDTLWNQNRLDFVFALSCLAMLAAMIWMFAKDYNREFKPIQRRGREIEVALLNQQKFEAATRSAAQLEAAKGRVIEALSEFGVRLPDDTSDDNFTERAKEAAQFAANQRVHQIQADLRRLRLDVERLDKHIAAENAVRDSMISAQQIFLQTYGSSNEAVLQAMEAAIQEKIKYLAGKRAELESKKAELREKERELASVKEKLTQAVEAYEAEARTRDRLARAAAAKKIGIAARIRAWPILDAFNSPYKIQEHVPEGLTINYNFKEVQRLDRCATCHMFIDRPTPVSSRHGFDKDSLRQLDDYAGLLRRTISTLSLDPDLDLEGMSESALEAELAGLLEAAGKSQGDLENLKNRLKESAVTKKLSASEIVLYAHHPRLDLFVGSNSKHPIEKFGCTICHSGQGGAAEFKFAYHWPDTGNTTGARYTRQEAIEAGDAKLENRPKMETFLDKKTRWQKERRWLPDLHPDNLWDHPMTPARFIESSCLKCHHHVTDLIRTDGKEEAPKLLKGYRLVRDLGCFGCHEISGWKSGRTIGPDMRLEPYPAFDDLPPSQRAKVLAAMDPTDPVGDLRKVGPGLRRLAEKSHEDFVRQWIRSPRDFRPGTKMPHAWGLENNTRERLSDAHDGVTDLPEQMSRFPDAEMTATAFYLIAASKHYLERARSVQSMPPEGEQGWRAESRLYQQLVDLDDNRKKSPGSTPTKPHPQLPAATPAHVLKERLLAPPSPLEKHPPVSVEVLTRDQMALLLEYLGDRERLRRAAGPLEQRKYPEEILQDGKPMATPAAQGLKLFKEKGCAACHSHEDVKVYNSSGENLADADFGPNLTNMADKLGPDREKARKWLFFWLTEPKDHYSRTRMPNPKLSPIERLTLANWLLETGQGTGALAPTDTWRKNAKKVLTDKETTEAMKRLARVYLDKAVTLAQSEQAVAAGLDDDVLKPMRADADERLLAAKPASGSLAEGHSAEDRLKLYVGKKTITRYGCYGCHDIPGFETAKPIGTPLNDWGKKESDRLDFGNIRDYLKEVHGVAPGKLDPDVYDPFFQYSLERVRRDGFLYQKLREPRSYDYAKLKDRPWDDRLRMPQFQFAHSPPRENESATAYAARLAREEQENIEAIMTFILGLVAENVPAKFVHRPTGDRLHEVKGTKLLERFNCVGCHVVKPGMYELPADSIPEMPRRPRRAPGDSDRAWAEKLKRWEEEKQKGRLASLLLDEYSRPGGDQDPHAFPAAGRPDKPPQIYRPHPGKYPVYAEHASWRQQRASPPARIILRGIPLFGNPDPSKSFYIQLWEATAFRPLTADGREEGELHHLPVGISTQRKLIATADLISAQPPQGGERFLEFYARAVVAPSDQVDLGKLDLLIGSSPPPLIREGEKVQPQWLLEFLLHPHEIRPLVYRRLKMPQFHLTEADAAALRDYFIAVDRLNNPALGLEYSLPMLPQQSADYQREKRLQYLEQYRDRIASAEEKTGADYFEAGWRVVTNTAVYCGKCHNTPGIYEVPPAEALNLGPALEKVATRLRPAYLERWLAAPGRLVPYTAMTPVIWADYWDGDSPAKQDPMDQGTKRNQPLDMFYVLPPDERVRVVRDVLLSWGRLTEPDKTPTYKAVRLNGPPHPGGH